jgi:hypothetical protein
MVEKLFKHIRHPVPAGPHIKHKTVRSILAGTTTGHTIFFQNGDDMPRFCQTTCSGQTSESGSNYNYSFCQGIFFVGVKTGRVTAFGDFCLSFSFKT